MNLFTNWFSKTRNYEQRFLRESAQLFLLEAYLRSQHPNEVSPSIIPKGAQIPAPFDVFQNILPLTQHELNLRIEAIEKFMIQEYGNIEKFRAKVNDVFTPDSESEEESDQEESENDQEEEQTEEQTEEQNEEASREAPREAPREQQEPKETKESKKESKEELKKEQEPKKEEPKIIKGKSAKLDDDGEILVISPPALAQTKKSNHDLESDFNESEEVVVHKINSVKKKKPYDQEILDLLSKHATKTKNK